MDDRRRTRPVGTGRKALTARTALTALALALGVAGCAGDAGGADLEGRSFVSTDVTGHELVSGTAVRLVFEDDTVSATAGCNTFNGAASWDGDALVVEEPMAATMMACDDALTSQDQWLEAFLLSEPSLALEGGTLTLGDDTEGITLEEE